MNGRIRHAPLNGNMTESSNITDLFHEDAQVSQLQSQPWWKIQLFVWEPVLFGTWDGVFTSCMINIFGVVLFLRTGWLVGNTGVLLGIFLVSAVILVALVTVLSGIGVCERCSIGSGGVYSMISTVLGGKVGGTVGLLYIFGQCVAGAMYITGFAESISDLLHLQSTWVVRGISLTVLVGLLGINLAGVKWIIRLQLLLLLLLAVSTLDFIIGSFSHLDPDHGFVGYSDELLYNNTFPDYTPGESFFSVFGVFFPAATGVMAGFNMSGDLRRPSVNIPVGSLAAIAISWFLYIVFVFLLGAICSREFLRYEFMIAEKVSLVGFLFLLGLYISSLASCMGGLYGAPRILQCIAQEKVIPILSFLGHGRGPNKTPVAAIFLTGLLTMAFVFIGQVNILAPIVTINFMLTYSAVDYSYFSVTMSYELQHLRRKVGRSTSRTPGSLQPLILDKFTSYGSNGTLLEFTKDMDQIFKPGHVDTLDSTKIQDKEQKKFMKLKKSRKPAKETLQDSFQLDQEPERRMSADVVVTSTEPESRATADIEATSILPENGFSQGQTHTDQEQVEHSDDTEDVERTGDQEQLVPEDHAPETDAKDESNAKQKVPEFEIQSLSSAFYSKLCNHWVSFIGAIVSIVIMFVIQWIYALANIGVAVLLYFYIGRVSPGLNPGAAANFSFFAWIRLLATTLFRKKPSQEQFVVTPTFAHVGMETTQLTEENADFASRGRFHHSSVISQGQFINQFN
ncbi:solute carrier family 12 member 8 [Hyla sarda]|uniref:solute carrier family 12 member 8 n=1 Tax=Hyla sarda TaxID=327740 RepID=UPI0024C2F8CB|nr:solute carrier family 12 member 8 [Hyla sarda]XP_056391950.1 solute carrier family 12 member 8 [Hyla sarda]XP_056391951.1 solute carrier family 12 member 8 [Hyla sarda]XP_056391952.1 solute carrier family 12 member 8 [Hyla sarda]